MREKCPRRPEEVDFGQEKKARIYSMSRAAKIRLNEELSSWLAETACQAKFIRTAGCDSDDRESDGNKSRVAASGRKDKRTSRSVLAPRFRDLIRSSWSQRRQDLPYKISSVPIAFAHHLSPFVPAKKCIIVVTATT